MKKVLAMMMALALLLCSFAGMAMAEEETKTIAGLVPVSYTHLCV